MEISQLIQAVNRAPARQECKPSKTGDEQRFEVALAEPRLRDSSLEDLKSALRYCMLKVGLRAANLPDEEERAILLAHVVSEYGAHTAAEIRLAFDMAIAGKLEIDRRDVVCYENFSCLYFSGIMNAYRQWADKAYRKMVAETLPLERELTAHEKLELKIEYIGCLRELEKKRFPKRFLPPLNHP